jgi:probable rRNA maturation factor
MRSVARYRVHLRLEPPFRARLAAPRVRAAALAALRHQAAPAGADLSVLVTGDEQLRELNRRYLGLDHATDVLSFPAQEVDPRTGRRYLGDIAISYPRAREQAARGGHPIWAEVQLLVVHGVLHLLGHDHARPAEKDAMWAAQAEILARLKAPLRGPVESSS